MNFEDLYLDFLINLPALITLIACALLTLASRHRHPPAARWALLGFVWLFITDVMSILWRTVGVFVIFQNVAPLGPAPVLSFLLFSICESVAYLFFLMALFVARTPYRPHFYYEDDGEN